MPFHKRVQLQAGGSSNLGNLVTLMSPSYPGAVFSPAQFQSEVLSQRGGDTVVQAPKQPGFSAFYMPATAELVKDVFAAEAAGAITQGLSEAGGYRAFATLLGEDSLLVVKDPERHKQLRTLLQPAFSSDAIATYLPDIQTLVSRYLGRWQAAGETGVKAHQEMKKLTFEFIMQVVLGHRIAQDELVHLSNLFSSLTKGLIAWPYLDIPFTNWHRALKAQQELVSYFQAGVTAARQQLEAGQWVPGVMGILVAAQDEHGVRLSDREITHNLLLVLLAGHDTSSTTLTRCMSNLQDHPRVLQKLRAEQQRVLTNYGSQVTAAALKDMTYADAVIRETLRLDPVVGAVMRVATEDMALGAYQVPQGTTLLVPLRHLAGTDPRWSQDIGDFDPAAFNPDRLLTPVGAKPGQLMPFGAGTRYCLGASLAMAEMKVYLALLARSYQFEADNNTKWKPALGYYPENGLPMVVKAWQGVDASPAL
eukprot:gene7859-8055_t